MPEKPREYKNRIDEQRRKRRRNRDELIECINEYELIDERYKAETKQEILASFEKNEKAEKAWELYVKIWEELANIEQKYQELEELKENLEAKRNEHETLKDELKAINIDCEDETTLMMQMQKVESINSKIEAIDVECKELEKKIEEREKEIKEIEETYWEKEGTDETSITEEKGQDISKSQEETTKKESPRTLQEYKEIVLLEKWKTDNIRWKIIKLLEEWTWIDETLKEKIKWKISDVFEKYNDEIEWSLKMKSARYMEDRKVILDLNTKIRIIWWKPCYATRKNWRHYVIRWEEQLWKEYNKIKNIQEIWWKPYFEWLRDDWGYDIIRWNNILNMVYIDKFWYEWSLKFEKSIWWRPVITINLDNGKQVAMWWEEQLWKEYKKIENIQEIRWKPYFEWLRDDWDHDIVRWNNVMNTMYIEKFWYEWSLKFEKSIWWRPFITINLDNGKQVVMWWEEQLWKEYKKIENIQEIRWKPYFEWLRDDWGYDIVRWNDIMNMVYIENFWYKWSLKFEKSIWWKPLITINLDNGQQVAMWWEEQLWKEYNKIENIQEIWWKPYFEWLRDDLDYDIIRWNEQKWEGFNFIDDLKKIWWKPCFRAEKDRKKCIIWWNEPLWDWFDDLDSLQEIWWKPCFRAKKDWKSCVMRWTEQQWDWFDDLDSLQEIWWKPCFRAKKDWKSCVMRWTEQQWDWFDYIHSPEEIWWKPCLIAKKDWKWCIMWWKEQLWKEYKGINDLQEIWLKPYFRWLRDDWYNDIIWWNKNLKLGYNERFTEWKYSFETKKSIWWRPFIVITLNDSKKELAMWWEEQLWKKYKKIENIQEIWWKPYFRWLRDDWHNDIIWWNENLKLGYNKRFTEWKYCFEIKKSIWWKPFIVITLNNSKKQIAMWWEEQLWKEYKEIDDLQEIWWKPCFEWLRDDWYSDIIWWNENLKLGYNERFTEWKYSFEIKKSIWWRPFITINLDNGKQVAMWWEEQQWNEYDDISSIKEIWWKPVFKAKKDWKWCIVEWGEQQWNWAKYESDLILDEITKKYQQDEDNEDTVIQKEWQKNSPREKREKIILERYQTKLNRDGLLKIILLSDAIDEETKKKLKSEILSDFYTEFEKVTSTKEFQELDKDYREIKKTERKKIKKSVELESQKEATEPEILTLDGKLCEIADFAMKLEDGLWLKKRKLKKAKEERNELESRQESLLEWINKIKIEKAQIESNLLIQQRNYGIKKERPKIKRKALKEDWLILEKLKSESTFKWYKKIYMELVSDKEKYMNDLLQQIESVDFWISEWKKKEIMEMLKTVLEKELESFKEWDEITKLADETEKWIKDNWKSVMEQIKDLKWKIEEKEIEREDLKSKWTWDDSKDIYKNKHEWFKLQKELLNLKNQYNSIKTELEEKLKKYDWTVIDWTGQIYVETRNEKIEREERERLEATTRKYSTELANFERRASDTWRKNVESYTYGRLYSFNFLDDVAIEYWDRLWLLALYDCSMDHDYTDSHSDPEYSTVLCFKVWDTIEYRKFVCRDAYDADKDDWSNAYKEILDVKLDENTLKVWLSKWEWEPSVKYEFNIK